MMEDKKRIVMNLVVFSLLYQGSSEGSRNLGFKGVCKDDPNGNCARYKKINWCKYTHIKKGCPKSCDECPGSCKDSAGSAACSRYQSIGWCNLPHIQQGCHMSCDACPGEWSEWLSWSECDVTCGGGEQERTRTCNGPRPCLGSKIDVCKCNTEDCPEPCGNWLPWSGCSNSCGGGSQQRTRSGSSDSCRRGDNKQSRECKTQSCSKPCGEWLYWSECSATCGSGRQQRTRSGSSDSCGRGDNKQSRECKTKSCSKPCGEWLYWSECSATCGSGRQQRTRSGSSDSCRRGDNKQSQECKTKSCSKPCGNWLPWSGCSNSCGGGRQQRTRSGSSDSCRRGNNEQSRECKTKSCSKPCGEWLYWSECSATCGSGRRQRTRSGSSDLCRRGDNKQSRECKTKSCSTCGDWLYWSECDVSCGHGTQRRRRVGMCDFNMETRKCSSKACPDWTPCSATCGNGIQIKLESSGQYSTKTCKIQDCDEDKWTLCSTTCGYGTQFRVGSSGQYDGVRSCKIEDCDKGLLPWEKWSGCDKDCGVGNQRRIRVCVDVDRCMGKEEEVKSCYLRSCGRDVAYSPCSKTCGDGVQYKLEATGQYSTRYCKVRDCTRVLCLPGTVYRFKNYSSCCQTKPASPRICHHTVHQSYQTSGSVTGWQNSAKGEWPWMVYILSQYGKCGGVLISSKFILTAARCLQSDWGSKYPARSFTVVIGFSDVHNRNVKYYPLARTIIHPKYDTLYHDIGLAELMKEITPYTSYIQPICLPHGEEVTYDATCIATGWEIGMRVSPVLQNARLQVYDPRVCIHGYSGKNASLVSYLLTRQGYVCTGDHLNQKDQCSSSSGSILACQRCDTCGWFVYGVGPKQCTTLGAPAIYTKVTDYEQWIYHVTGITKELLMCSNKNY